MKKIMMMLVVIITIILIVSAGCVNNSDSTIGIVNDNGRAKIYVDCETGVNYLWIVYPSGFSICPRYNADGTLMVTPV